MCLLASRVHLLQTDTTPKPFHSQYTPHRHLLSRRSGFCVDTPLVWKSVPKENRFTKLFLCCIERKLPLVKGKVPMWEKRVIKGGRKVETSSTYMVHSKQAINWQVQSPEALISYRNGDHGTYAHYQRPLVVTSPPYLTTFPKLTELQMSGANCLQRLDRQD